MSPLSRENSRKRSCLSKQHYAQIFGNDPRFLLESFTEAKRRFCEEMDLFLFRSGGVTIGLFCGHPSDWSTYYVRSIAILPEYRERRLATELFAALARALAAAGVARWDGDVSPANTAILRTLLRHGSIVTASISSERWGQSLRLTKFLREDAGEIFHRQFLNTPAFGRHPQPIGRRTS
jgi:ribosomal protein S18 acetylase RimI-like enzyme